MAVVPTGTPRKREPPNEEDDPWIPDASETPWSSMLASYETEERLWFKNLMLKLTKDRWDALTSTRKEKANVIADLLTFPGMATSPYVVLANQYLQGRKNPAVRQELQEEILSIAALSDMNKVHVIATHYLKLMGKRREWIELEKHLETLFRDLFLCNINVEMYRAVCIVRLPHLKMQALQTFSLSDIHEEVGKRFRTLIPRCRNELLLKTATNRKIKDIQEPDALGDNSRLVQRLRTTLSTKRGPNGTLLVYHYVQHINAHFAKKGRNVVKFFAGTGSGKSTTLVIAMTRHFPVIWLMTPTTTAATLLYKKFISIGVVCGIRTGKPSTSFNGILSDYPLLICTYGMAKKFINNGLFPDLLIFDECNIECSDRDVVVKMMQLDKQWKKTTKVLALSANTPSDARMDLDTLSRAATPIVEMVEENELFIAVAKYPILLLVGVIDLIDHFQNACGTYKGWGEMKRRFLRATTVGSRTNPEAERYMDEVWRHRRVLNTIVNCWKQSTYYQSVMSLNELMDNVMLGDARWLLLKIQNSWRSTRQHLMNEIVPEIDMTIGVVISFLKHTDSSYNRFRNDDESELVPLVFCTSLSEMLALKKDIHDHASVNNIPKVEVMIVHSETVNCDMLELLSAPPDGVTRRVILASSLAETSVTLSSVGMVVDSQTIKKEFINPVTEARKRIKLKTTNGQTTQRMGRTGRTVNGVYVNIHKPLPSEQEGFPIPFDRRAMENLMGVIVDMVVFHASRDRDLERDALVNMTAELSLHAVQVVEAVLEELMDMQLIVISTDKRVFITRAGYEVSLLPCEVPTAYFIVLGSRLGVVRSTMWYSSLMAEYPRELFDDDTDLDIQNWSSFFKMSSSYTFERMTEMRSVGMYVLLARNEKDSLLRAFLDEDRIRSAKLFMAKTEKIYQSLFPMLPKVNEDAGEGAGGGTVRNEKKGDVALLAGLIGSRNKIVRLENIHEGINAYGNRMGILKCSSVDRAVGCLMTDIGYHGPILTDGEGRSRIPNITCVPNLMAAIGAQLFKLPTNVNEDKGHFNVDQMKYKTTGNKDVNDMQKLLLLRGQLRKLLTTSLACPAVYHPSKYNKELDDVIEVIRNSLRESQDSLTTLYDGFNQDDELVRLRRQLKNYFGYPAVSITLTYPFCCNETDIYLPPIGFVVGRYQVCRLCFYRGHAYQVCTETCYRVTRDCNHRKIVTCPCTNDEIALRRELLLEEGIYRRVVPFDSLHFPAGARLLRDIHGNTPNKQALVAEYKNSWFNLGCGQCGSPFHNYGHHRCLADDVICMMCMCRHNETNERCDIRYKSCNYCQMDIHLSHRCQEAHRYVFRHYPDMNMIQFREYLDELHPRRHINANRVGRMVPNPLTPAQKEHAQVVFVDQYQQTPCNNADLEQPHLLVLIPNDHHLLSAAEHTF